MVNSTSEGKLTTKSEARDEVAMLAISQRCYERSSKAVRWIQSEVYRFSKGEELKLVVYHVNVFRFFFVTGSIVIPRSGSLRDWAISILSNTNIETR